MKINNFILLVSFITGVVVAFLSREAYVYQREMQIKTISEEINRSFYRLEKDLQKVLESKDKQQVQLTLDRTAAINPAIDIISISLDGVHIDFSSSRSLKAQTIQGKYDELESIFQGLLKEHTLQYKSDFYYFDDAKKSNVEMLVTINRTYVFGELDKAAILYGLSFALIFTVVSIILFVSVQRLFVMPFLKLTEHARNKNIQNENYFIDELTQLDTTLASSFQSMIKQQESLQEALNETQYLDAILRTVADINQLLIASKNGDELMQNSVDRLAEHQGYAACWIAFEENGMFEINVASDEKFVKKQLATLHDHHDPIIQAYNSVESVIVSHLATQEISQGWISAVQGYQFGSFIALPLRSNINEPSFGVLGLYAFDEYGFKEKEVAMLEELAGDIGFAIRSFQRHEELEYHLSTDAITTLPNRIVLLDKLAQNSKATLALINLDRFNDINEIYGISVGDGVLQKYAEWLLQKTVLCEMYSLYKLSSDEYALIFSDKLSLQQCEACADELIQATANEKFLVNEIEISLSITIGMACGFEHIIEHATAALKHAKSKRKSYELYVDQTNPKDHANNIVLYKKIKEAIEQDRVVPFFQPIVDNKTKKIVKYEALMRILDQDESVLNPASFLEFAKITRLYKQLTKVMVEKVFAKLQSCTLPVSINLSTEDLLNTQLADYLEEMILQYDIGKKVIFEILESEGIDNYNIVHAFMERFKVLQCRFAIDDFGAGYSNFDHLLKLKIDILKIDASLIKNLPTDPNARLFVEHINSFAQKIGFETVAEFVADEAIYDEVRRIGIDCSQGYHFYQPIADIIDGNIHNDDMK